MNTSMQSLRAGLIVLCLTGTAVALASDDKNLVSNGNFEEVKDGVPTGWFSVCNEGGSVTHKALAEGAKEGKSCLHVKSKGEWAVAGSSRSRPLMAAERSRSTMRLSPDMKRG